MISTCQVSFQTLMKQTRDPTSSASGIELHKMLFNPYSLYGSTGLDDAIGGAMSTPLGKYDQFFTTELTERLFEKSEDLLHDRPCGLDLVSLNIQRGRDHGLPSYPHWRKHCRLPPVDTWTQMADAVDPGSLEQMKKMYAEPENVDVYSGALSEPPVKGGVVGPLITCLLGDQFVRLKQGDSFWYERRRGPQRFTRGKRKFLPYPSKTTSFLTHFQTNCSKSTIRNCPASSAATRMPSAIPRWILCERLTVIKIRNGHAPSWTRSTLERSVRGRRI